VILRPWTCPVRVQPPLEQEPTEPSCELTELIAVLSAAVTGGRTARALGRYVDYFRRIDGTWKVVYRRVVPDVTFPGDDAGNYWSLSSDRTDPRYDRLTAPPAD
jgi:hypothetical protein